MAAGPALWGPEDVPWLLSACGSSVLGVPPIPTASGPAGHMQTSAEVGPICPPECCQGSNAQMFRPPAVFRTESCERRKNVGTGDLGAELPQNQTASGPQLPCG